MRSQYFSAGSDYGRVDALRARAAVLVLVFFVSLVAGHPAKAHGGGAAAAVASTGLEACSSNGGKALYDCVANVLETMSNRIIFSKGEAEVQRSLQTAASRLRAAVNKVQALSAITQCRAVVAGALRQIKASGGPGTGLSAIAGVLAQAAKLIQAKG